MNSLFTQSFGSFSKSIGDANVRKLVSAGSSVELPAYRKLIRDRMPVDSIYFLLEGEVAVSVDEGDKMIPLGNLGPGQWLGEISVLSGEMLASSSVTTVTPVKLLRLKHQAFEDLLSSSDVVARAVLDEMVKMLTERLKTSLNAGSVPITAAEIDKPQKRVGLLWSLFGGSGG